MVKCTINNEQGECVGVFLPTEVQKYYKLRDPEERLNTDFMVKFYEIHDTSRLLASWWKEDKKFTNRSTGWYNTVNLREPYMYLMALICRLYGEKDCSKFSEAWMPLAYTVEILGSNFNWGAIISKQLSINISQAQTPKEGEVLTFYMASYLLDVICARNIFAGMNLSWHVSELHVHVYFNILWENRYKRSYALICDEFLARVYFLIFRKECPRLSVAAKKMIEKVGHWYFEETSTYIRVFGATDAPHLLPVHVPDHLILGEILLPDHLARLQCLPGQRQEERFHSLWFPHRILHGQRHCTCETGGAQSTRVPVSYRSLSQARSQGLSSPARDAGILLLVVCS
jgi:hypothetical protein